MSLKQKINIKTIAFVSPIRGSNHMLIQSDWEIQVGPGMAGKTK